MTSNLSCWCSGVYSPSAVAIVAIVHCNTLNWTLHIYVQCAPLLSNEYNLKLEQKNLFRCKCIFYVFYEPDSFYLYIYIYWYILSTGPLKPKVVSKNPWMGDYMQKKWLNKGFNLVGMCQQYSWEETSINSVLLFTIGIVQNICHFGLIVILSLMFTALKNVTCTGNKYKLAKVKNILKRSHCKK